MKKLLEKLSFNKHNLIVGCIVLLPLVLSLLGDSWQGAAACFFLFCGICAAGQFAYSTKSIFCGFFIFPTLFIAFGHFLELYTHDWKNFDSAVTIYAIALMLIEYIRLTTESGDYQKLSEECQRYKATAREYEALKKKHNDLIKSAAALQDRYMDMQNELEELKYKYEDLKYSQESEQ